MFAAGELAMPAYDLAQWDISMMNRSLLGAKSYDEMFAPVMLKDGSNSHYGLGLFVEDMQGHPYYEHSGRCQDLCRRTWCFRRTSWRSRC
jgi:hypothetical protein